MTNTEKAHQACIWLRANLLDGNRHIVEEIGIDPGNIVRRSTDVHEGIREIVESLCGEFERLEAMERRVEKTQTGAKAGPTDKKLAAAPEKPKPAIKKRGKK